MAGNKTKGKTRSGGTKKKMITDLIQLLIVCGIAVFQRTANSFALQSRSHLHFTTHMARRCFAITRQQ